MMSMEYFVEFNQARQLIYIIEFEDFIFTKYISYIIRFNKFHHMVLKLNNSITVNLANVTPGS